MYFSSKMRAIEKVLWNVKVMVNAETEAILKIFSNIKQY